MAPKNHHLPDTVDLSSLALTRFTGAGREECLCRRWLGRTVVFLP